MLPQVARWPRLRLVREPNDSRVEFDDVTPTKRDPVPISYYPIRGIRLLLSMMINVLSPSSVRPNSLCVVMPRRARQRPNETKLNDRR